MSVLGVESVFKSFGDLPALTNVSFELQAGERVALIGPNGAGKTTLINIISGIFPPTSGDIRLSGTIVTRQPSHRRVTMGLARSFQLNTLFNELDLMTNILLAIQGTQAKRYRLMRAMTSERENIALARDLLESVDLWRERYAPVSELSHGQQRQVEIIMALASNPKMILLDEPSAGLTPGESEVLSEIIRALPSETTVFFSAHDLDLVFSLADKVIVLHQGEVIAEKPPAQIQTDPKVREVYLGVKHQEPSGA